MFPPFRRKRYARIADAVNDPIPQRERNGVPSAEPATGALFRAKKILITGIIRIVVSGFYAFSIRFPLAITRVVFFVAVVLLATRIRILPLLVFLALRLTVTGLLRILAAGADFGRVLLRLLIG